MFAPMNVLLFGATGMVGDAVLHECLQDARVSSVLAITRSPLGVRHARLRELRRADFHSYDDVAAELASIDACFFCLGVSAVGLSEREYRHQTFDLTLAAGRALAAAHPGAVFCYVSGEGTDRTEKGRTMWARVKGATENALLALPLQAYMFRPGFIRRREGGPLSKTLLYRMGYAVAGPLYPLLRRIAPTHVTTAENVGRAMIEVAAHGHASRVLENVDINRVGSATSS
jgi:uncharacterized protein YbjT (DUF2867 family)